MIDIDYERLSEDVASRKFRERLTRELVLGFEQTREQGGPPPPASYYATKIAEIIDQGAEDPIDSDLSFEIDQEILLACQEAWALPTGEEGNEERRTCGV